MRPLASHALFFGGLFVIGWTVVLVCRAAERRAAASCVRRCCIPAHDETPRRLDSSSRGLSDHHPMRSDVR